MNPAQANAMVAEFLHDAMQPQYPHLVDAAEIFGTEPTDLQLLDARVEAFPMDAYEMIERLICFDFVALRRELAK